jgi:hypothetical protein
MSRKSMKVKPLYEQSQVNLPVTAIRQLAECRVRFQHETLLDHLTIIGHKFRSLDTYV